MRFFRRKKQEVQPKQVEQVMSVCIKGMPTDMSASEAAWHGVHALSGLLMDRHSQCRSHWWCGTLPEGFSRKVIGRVTGVTLAGPGPGDASAAIAVYLGTGYYPKKVNPTNEQEAIAWLDYLHDVPYDALALQLSTEDNAWVVAHGMVINAAKGNQSSGEIDGDRSALRTVADCPAWATSPAPSYSSLDKYDLGGKYQPRLHCLERPDDWLICLIDPHKPDGGLNVNAVAVIPKVDNPDHMGLYSEDDMKGVRAGELKDDLGYLVGPGRKGPDGELFSMIFRNKQPSNVFQF